MDLFETTKNEQDAMHEVFLAELDSIEVDLAVGGSRVLDNRKYVYGQYSGDGYSRCRQAGGCR